MTIQLVAKDFIPDLPDKFKCPICGAKIVIEEIDEWEQDESGQWFASDGHINCVTEPDIDSREWRAWDKGHWSMPYVDWLPLSQKVEQWLKENFRFDLDGRTAEEELQALADWNAGLGRKV